MRVLIVRHGEAVDPYEVDNDAMRWLTPHGRTTMRNVGALLHEHGVRLDHVFTSPLVRAVQTAELLAQATGFAAAPRVHAPLAGGSTAQALSVLERLADEATTAALVGHEPQVRALASHLLAEPVPAFRTGGTCVIEWNGRAGRLEMAVDPKALRIVTRLEDLPL
jgi:phosphohistidine phosphatase